MSAEKTALARLGILVALAFSALWSWYGAGSVALPAAGFSVAFLDVGQGDATFITTPEGQQVLIDGGATTAVLRELASQMSPFDTTIDLVVATHPDTDHVGGLVDVLERYEVGEIVMTENKSDSPAGQAFARAATEEGATITMARRGQVWQLGASTTLSVLFPETNPSDMESNASSVILKVEYGAHSFLLTGDAPKRIEEYLVLTDGEYLKSTVLKVGHHGSRTSTSELFLAEVEPEYAVISASTDNRYGHPHVEVTDALFNYGVTTFSTALDGTIVFGSDGAALTVR